MEPQSGGWHPQDDGSYEQMRAPKAATVAATAAFSLSVAAQPFVPRGKQTVHNQPQQQQPQPPFSTYAAPMQSRASQLNQRMEQAASGGSVVEPVGGGGDFSVYPGGGGSNHMGNYHGMMMNGNDAVKQSSALVNRLNHLTVRDRPDPKQEHHHQQPPMHHQQHHLQHQQPQQRLQQYQQQQLHHPHHHHHQQQQQQNHHGHSQLPQQLQQQQVAYGVPYGVGHSNAINNQLNHPILGANLGMGGENRKHNGPAGGQQHRSRQQQHHHHQQGHQQHHHHPHHHQSIGGGGGGGGGGGNGMMAGGGMGGNAGMGEFIDDVQTSDEQAYVLDYLTEVIAELYDNPGMFEDLKQKVPKMFADYREDRYVLSNAVEMIFEQSIKESNFRYMGARLCQLLDSLDDSPNSILRMMFQLKMEDQQNELMQLKHDQAKVRGTTLFLAELYMQLRNPHHNLTNDVAGRIIAAIEILLQKGGPENVKCVCQCLKLCGFELEQDCREDVLNILEKLRGMEKKVMSSVVPLIHSVMKLQQQSWGRSEELVPVAPVPTMPDPMAPGVGLPLGLEFHDSPVFYGPDGKVLSEEENSFLETNLASKRYAALNGYDDDDDAYDVVDDQDPEVQLAFENFVAESNNRQQHH
ncbi:uncharacterized protein LOC131206656 isoform X2 [Anopheles bellator]|uniref:uncharacterized protein LOC131206656 isoform X2 n=1 Tax=Anopheles bellator TaxID=139047 RepID=UPI0026473DC6|nr:uncharacterized protein LOC131206656 isoform X2 [Anopheles bellator]